MEMPQTIVRLELFSVVDRLNITVSYTSVVKFI